MWAYDFNKNQGPGTASGKPQPLFGLHASSQPQSSWFNGSSVKHEGHQNPVGAPVFPSHNRETDFPPINQVQDLKRTRSPPILSTYKDALQNSTTAVGRPSFSPPRLSTRPTSQGGSQSNAWHRPSTDPFKSKAPVTNPSDFPVPKRTRLPFTSSTDPGLRGNGSSVLDNTESHSVAQRTKYPHFSQRNNPGEGSGPSRETRRPSVSYADLDEPEVPATNPINFPVLKGTRLPFTTSTDPGLQGNHSSVLDDTERELQAKAKRMARFKDELSQPEPSETGNRNQKSQQVDHLGTDKRKLMGEASDMTGHLRNSNLQNDGEDQDSSNAIVGYCPDMCPEQERAERERKGDLDQYERLDGDRNQTTGSLAVKKYTRTAEREAALIRPMEILQKTMDYLLSLLDQPYDDRFLGLYNFLWDRMRAVRMDLRMQHIFNLGAITMLEQMIRLHIIAMHELCQYTKGEGFSEGFDAHLNIEQMNKTSVELFQLYDDHRKKGIKVPTEREFRGYYALLKLDKHPGYKVEPSELSLDLAKMTPGIRQAAEVLFARNVARACRTSNFIAFFRLVRKASYLQACLMHAHFGKLRTLALASLHSGLQTNQGIPLSQVAKWLGMEDENLEDLLEYHGFSIKDFDEPYMVKERQFLNGDSEYPLKCSKLVHMKRSTTVVEDVLSSPITSFPAEDPKGVQFRMPPMQEESPALREKTPAFVKPMDSHMADVGDEIVKNETKVQSVFTPPVVDSWDEDQRHIEVASRSPRDIFKNINSFKSPKVVTASVVNPGFDMKFRNSFEKQDQSNISAASQVASPRKFTVETLPDVQMDFPVEDSLVQPDFLEDLEPKEPENAIEEVPNEIELDASINEEVAEAKLKLILRLWRRRASTKKDLRIKKLLAANAALSSLSLGLPMWHYKELSKVPLDFNIDRAMCERYEKQEQLWSTVHVSNVVAPILGQRYQYPKCVCWKLLFWSLDLETRAKVSDLDLGSWLRYKLMPENIGNSDDIVASSQNLSIWKKLDYGKSAGDWTYYLSVVRNIEFDSLAEETVLGTSAVMFLASEGISWEAQKLQLFNLVSLIPCGSCLPLLILSVSDPSTIVENLGLNEVDKSKIICFSVVSLDGFFSDEFLRKGLEWLASHSPVQPVVHCVKTRELVLNHLQFVQFDAHNISPEQCIVVINDAVDDSIKDIVQAAKSNPICWPCPEISLLNGPDYQILESHLPRLGWSSATRIGPLTQALRNCKLPSIPNDISWCCNRSLTGININNQKQVLEHFLVSYLSPLMGLPLAQKETSALIQSCVGLELHGSMYYLAPKWLMIFRRVLNWQLISLSNSEISTAYILEQKDIRSQFASESLDTSYQLISPSLDEMIEVSCCTPIMPDLGRESTYKEMSTAVVCDRSEDDEMVVSRDDEAEEEIRKIYVENESKKDRESERRLSRLLEQCKIVQDRIDTKLSVYF
uniref:SAC3 family protein B isoform X2 n=1 Tax=Erigeron canadensis TaxID=72917 RepID=UPI001CB9B692|nr:SAC3 family protein B isoform X2 [Erigeron canadensis]